MASASGATAVLQIAWSSDQVVGEQKENTGNTLQFPNLELPPQPTCYCLLVGSSDSGCTHSYRICFPDLSDLIDAIQQ